MPPSEPCPECEAKVILNGDIAGKNLQAAATHLDVICETIEHHRDSGKQFDNILHLVELANELEDKSNEYQELVDGFRKAVLKSIGFKGPWPASLS